MTQSYEEIILNLSERSIEENFRIIKCMSPVLVMVTLPYFVAGEQPVPFKVNQKL